MTYWANLSTILQPWLWVLEGYWKETSRPVLEALVIGSKLRSMNLTAPLSILWACGHSFWHSNWTLDLICHRNKSCALLFTGVQLALIFFGIFTPTRGRIKYPSWQVSRQLAPRQPGKLPRQVRSSMTVFSGKVFNEQSVYQELKTNHISIYWKKTSIH